MFVKDEVQGDGLNCRHETREDLLDITKTPKQQFQKGHAPHSERMVGMKWILGWRHTKPNSFIICPKIIHLGFYRPSRPNKQTHRCFQTLSSSVTSRPVTGLHPVAVLCILMSSYESLSLNTLHVFDMIAGACV